MKGLLKASEELKSLPEKPGPRCNLTRAPNPDGSESRVVVDWYYGEATVSFQAKSKTSCTLQSR